MIDVRHLKTLVALSEAGSLTQAAERVFLTQSALSHQLKALEDEIGGALFVRKSAPLRFSPAGERLLVAARRVLEEVEAARRDVAKLAAGAAGRLRIAVECHSCFDWLMPAMDTFREHWPEVEMDLVSGFHADPVALFKRDQADLAITSDPRERRGVAYLPLFQAEMQAILARDHPLAGKPYLTARDFSRDLLITYPAPEEMFDLIRLVLKPAGIAFARRTAELTVAILQLVASRKGIAALPVFGVESYLARGYVVGRPITRQGFYSSLSAAVPAALVDAAYVADFAATVRRTCFAHLSGIRSLAIRKEPR